MQNSFFYHYLVIDEEFLIIWKNYSYIFQAVGSIIDERSTTIIIEDVNWPCYLY